MATQFWARADNQDVISQMAATLLAGELSDGRRLEAIADDDRIKKAAQIAVRLFNETQDAIRAGLS